MEFIANSEFSKKIKKLALMLRELDVNVNIYGSEGSGKTFLAQYIAQDYEFFKPNLKTTKTVIIEDYDNIQYIPAFKRIIAISKKENNDFLVNIELKPLKDRKEDIPDFIKLFAIESKQNLKCYNNIEFFDLDTTNLNTLKKTIYEEILISCLDNFSDYIKKYIAINYSNQSYKELLKEFDKGLIEALLPKYKSMLKLSKQLDINRMTLTKKAMIE